DGLIPIRSIGREFFLFDREAQTLVGSETGLSIELGRRVVVRLSDVVPVTGGIELELVSLDGKSIPRAAPGRAGKPARKKAKKTARAKRKVSRRRR
ncbi:MAG: ribonuclease R, partial [Boseongicola sp.]|nr:ribonuclease R [Boseongicola sp.]